jgi:hypothetical protein
MNVALDLSPEATALVSKVLASFQSAMASIPPFVDSKDLVTLKVDGDFFGGAVTITLSPSPALLAWADTVNAKLEAFTKAI